MNTTIITKDHMVKYAMDVHCVLVNQNDQPVWAGLSRPEATKRAKQLEGSSLKSLPAFEFFSQYPGKKIDWI